MTPDCIISLICIFEFKTWAGGRVNGLKRFEQRKPAQLTFRAADSMGPSGQRVTHPKRYAGLKAVGSDDDRTEERRRRRQREAAAGTAEVGGRRRFQAPVIDGDGRRRRCRGRGS